jgi:hypothetical protein
MLLEELNILSHGDPSSLDPPGPESVHSVDYGRPRDEPLRGGSDRRVEELALVFRLPSPVGWDTAARSWHGSVSYVIL